MAKSPQVKFSNWLPWDERDKLPSCREPGVYILAHFSEAPKGVADPLDSHIRYIGQTCAQGGVIRRLRRFDASARLGVAGHSGGQNYHQHYGSIQERLYVAAYIPKDHKSEAERNALIRYVERKVIWTFVVRRKSLPKCNLE